MAAVCLWRTNHEVSGGREKSYGFKDVYSDGVFFLTDTGPNAHFLKLLRLKTQKTLKNSVSYYYVI